MNMYQIEHVQLEHGTKMVDSRFYMCDIKQLNTKAGNFVLFCAFVQLIYHDKFRIKSLSRTTIFLIITCANDPITALLLSCSGELINAGENSVSAFE